MVLVINNWSFYLKLYLKSPRLGDMIFEFYFNKILLFISHA